MSFRSTLDCIMAEHQLLRETRVLKNTDLGWIAAVRFNFAAADIYIAADPEDEMVTVSLEAPSPKDGLRWEEGPAQLRSAIGMRLHWWWRMQNNQGYWDGVQVEFTRERTWKGRVTVQMLAIASRLSVQEVKSLE